MNMGREAQDEPHESSLPCPTKTLVLRGSQKKPSTRQVDTLGFSKKRHSHSTLPHYSSIDRASLASLQEAIEDLSKAVQQGHRTGQEPAHQGSLEGAGLEREEGWEGTGSCEDEVGNGLKHSLGRGSLWHECGDSLGEDAVGGEGASRWCPSRLPSLDTLSLSVESCSTRSPGMGQEAGAFSGEGPCGQQRTVTHPTLPLRTQGVVPFLGTFLTKLLMLDTAVEVYLEVGEPEDCGGWTRIWTCGNRAPL